MLQQGISRGNENASDLCFRKKSVSGKSKGLKQRSKALSDVKNTIHSHASSLVEKSKNGNKKGKTSNSGFGKSTKKRESSKSFTVVKDENEIESGIDMLEPEIECINHFICEKENDSSRAEFLDEYKLTENEINCFSNRMNFFRIDPPPFRINALTPVEEIELTSTKNAPLFKEDDLIDDMSFEVPEPVYL